MTKRLALTPAVGLFAGLSVVSYGAANMLLNGVHGVRQASSNSCATSATASPTTTATTRALTRPAAHTGARAQHPAGMPVLLAYDATQMMRQGTQAPAGQGQVLAQGNQPAGGVSASQTQTASQSTAPLPSSQPRPSASAPPLPQPSPGSSAAPQPSVLPQPGPAGSTNSKPITPGGTLNSPNNTPTATPTTTSPTPTTTPTTSPPPGTLCIKMQTLGGVSAVDPHTNVRYAIWVWITSGTGATVKVTLSAKPTSVSPAFSVCAVTGTSKCTVSGLDAGQQPELQAKVAAPDRPAKRFVVTATATSPQASNSATASATVDIKPKNPSPTSSPTPNAGVGGTLPPGVGLPSGTTIPGLGVQPTGDLGSAFPQVSPSSLASPSAAASQHAHKTQTVDLSAGLPLDVRLIGGQVIGLAVLAAAITIAVARLSLRRQPAKRGQDSGGS
jgi:hypothetical protein